MAGADPSGPVPSACNGTLRTVGASDRPSDALAEANGILSRGMLRLGWGA